MPRSTNTQFAVAAHALILLAHQPDELLSSEEIAVSVGGNPVHMRRVLGHLRSAGLVDSRPGPGGGWRLCRNPAAISLGEVWRAVDDAEHVLGLHAANPDCPIGRKVHGALLEVDRRAAAALAAELDRTTVADMMQIPSRAPSRPPEAQRGTATR